MLFVACNVGDAVVAGSVVAGVVVDSGGGGVVSKQSAYPVTQVEQGWAGE